MFKNKFFYSVILIVAFWLMLMYEGVFIEGVFLAVIGIELVAGILKYVYRANLEADLYVNSKNFYVGDELVTTIKLSNSFFLPINHVELICEYEHISGEVAECIMVTNVGSYSNRTCHIKHKLENTGVINVRLKGFKVYDMLGISAVKKKLNKIIDVYVRPKENTLGIILDTQNRIHTCNSDIYSDIVSGSDKSEVFEVREYVPGDSLRDIHWKLSSKSDAVMVKTYSQPITNVTNIFVDFEKEKKDMADSKSISEFFTYIYSLVNELKLNGEEVNLYVFSKNGEGIEIVDGQDILTADLRSSKELDVVMNTFSKVNTQGRSILISSRLNREKVAWNYEEYINCYIEGRGDKETGNIVIKDVNVIGYESGKENKEPKKSIKVTENMTVDKDDEEISVYARTQKILTAFFGGFASIGILADTIIYNDDRWEMFWYAFAAAVLMLATEYIKKVPFRVMYVLILCIAAFLFAGIENVVNGAVGFVDALEKDMVYEFIDKKRVFGLIAEDTGNVQLFLNFIAFLITMVLYQFSWKRMTVLVYLLITMPCTLICFIYGQVTSGVHTTLLLAFLYIIAEEKITFSAIVKNEKNKQKKANMKSTTNVAAANSIFLVILIIIIMSVNYIKGYDRSEWMTEVKQEISSFMNNFYTEVIRGKSVNSATDDGKLGEVDEVVIEDTVELVVTIKGKINFPIYLKGYTGSKYVGNAWENYDDDNFKYIVSELERHDSNISEIVNVPYYIAREDYLGHVDSIFAKVKNATISVEKADGRDTHIYVPYGANVTGINYELDGVTEKDRDNQIYVYDVYQFYSVDDLYKDKIPYAYRNEEKAYRESSELIYTNTAYWRAIYDDLYYTLTENEYDYKGEKYDLTEGTKRNGYLPYIQCVKSYFLSDYEYTLSPGKLGENEDFIEKFIREKQGYCVHYASLATIMFRMFGIPARYCEGYVVEATGMEELECEQGNMVSIEVTDRQAHAWTEIYISGYGWYPVEVTPPYIDANTVNPIIKETTDEVVTKDNKETEETTKKKEETTTEKTTEKTTEETTTINEIATDDEENPDTQKKGRLLDILAMSLFMVTVGYLIAGITKRQVNRRKRIKRIKGPDRRIGVNQLNTEVNYTFKLADIKLSGKLTREKMAAKVSRYIMTNIPKKYLVAYDRIQFEKNLIYMYEIFDKASYGNENVTDKEWRKVEKIAKSTNLYVYLCQKRVKKIYMKYIKYLYLK